MSNIEPVSPRMGFDTAPFKNDSNNFKKQLAASIQNRKQKLNQKNASDGCCNCINYRQ